MITRLWKLAGAIAYVALVIYAVVSVQSTNNRVEVLERTSACREDLSSTECKQSITAAMQRCVTEADCSRLIRQAVRRGERRRRDRREGAGAGAADRRVDATRSGASRPSSPAPETTTPPDESAPPATEDGSDLPPSSPPSSPPTSPPDPSPPPPDPEPPSPPPDRGGLGGAVDDTVDGVRDTTCGLAGVLC